MRPISVEVQKSVSLSDANLGPKPESVKGTKSFFGHTGEVYRAGIKNPEKLDSRVFDTAIRIQSYTPKQREQLELTATRLGMCVPKTDSFSSPQQAILTLLSITSQEARSDEQLKEFATVELTVANLETATIMMSGEIPLDQVGNKAAREDLKAMQEKLDTLQDKINLCENLPKGVKEVLMEAIDKQIENLDARINHLKTTVSREPLTEGRVTQARVQWFDASLRVIDSLIKNSPPWAQQGLQELRQELVDAKHDELNGNDVKSKKTFTGDTDKMIKNFSKELTKKIEDRVDEIGLKAQHVGIKGAEGRNLSFGKALGQAHALELNSSGWKKVETRIEVGVNGVPKTFGNSIEPGSTLGNVFDTTYNKGEGISSGSGWEKTHSVNLARTTLKDSEGKTLFQGIRHGILSAFGIKDKAARQEANLNRAQETAQAALVSNPQLLEKALNGETVELNINSISLVTPDWLRGGFGLRKMAEDNEQAQLKDQFKAWNDLKRGNPVEMEVMNKDGDIVKVKVNVNVNMMNFGVNVGAVGSGSFKNSLMSFFALGAWKQVENENKAGLKHLLGDNLKDTAPLGGSVGKFLADPTKTAKEKEIVTELAKQIREMWNSGAYKTESHDPHKMVARLAVLSHMLGETPCFNCKSGKDRTGVLDVEAKFLAARIESTGTVPPYGIELSDDDKEAYRQFSINSGNLEIQRSNTGYGGFKNQLLESTKERLGHDEHAMRFHKGGSAFVHT